MMKDIIKQIIKESVRQYLKEDTFLQGTWFHGSKKDWDGEPHLTVGEFDNMGGFFLTKNLNFAKAYGNIIKAYNIDPNANIFDFIENKNHLLIYAQQIKKETEEPRKFDIEYPIPTYMTVEDYASILDTTIGTNQLFNNIYKFIRKAYPNIEGSNEDLYNTIMDDYKYRKLAFIINRRELYKDYPSIERNDTFIKRAGFDGAYVYESNNKNIQIYNLDVITNIGTVNTNKLNESIKNNKVTCDNCGWQWNLKDGGDDPYVCHKCGHDNNPKTLNEKCWKGYTQKGMKTMFGKRYPNCVKKKLKEQEDYRSSHTAPSKEENASLDRLTDIYPNDIYSSKALQYYGDGHPFDRLAIYIMQSAKDKPNKLIKIYRAVPDLNYKIKQKIKELLKINQYYDKFNFFPINNNIIDNLKYDYPIEKYSYDKQTQMILSDISNQIDNLKNQLKNTKLTINNGDWVTITPQYANLHGKAHLNNKYKVLTKTVPARTLYTDANSIHEWGYNP